MLKKILKNVILIMLNILGKYGLTSRTLVKLYEGTITSSTGRDDIIKVVLDLIFKHPFGVGVGVERISIFHEIYYKKGILDNLSSSYPHNFFLEIIVQFGIFIGSLIIIYVLYIIFKAMIKGNEEERDIVIIFFSIGFIHLLVSSTYLQSQYLFYLLGISVNICKFIQENKRAII
mgnify:CR=1 FL=1